MKLHICAILMALISHAALADVYMFEEEDKIIDQVGYTATAVNGAPYNLGYVMLVDPTSGESALCTYGSLIAFDVFDTQHPENKLFYSTLVAAKISNQPVWLTFSYDDSTDACTLTGVRLSSN